MKYIASFGFDSLLCSLYLDICDKEIDFASINNRFDRFEFICHEPHFWGSFWVLAGCRFIFFEPKCIIFIV